MRDETGPCARETEASAGRTLPGAAQDEASREAWDTVYRRSDGAVAAPVGASTLFFSENGQRLYALTPTAAEIWRSLSQGATPQMTSRRLIEGGEPPRLADSLVQDLLTHWTGSGDLYPADFDHPFPSQIQRLDLSVGGFAAQVILEGGMDVAPFRAVFGQFIGQAGTGGREYRFAPSGGLVYAFDGQRCLGAAPAGAAVPRLKALLTEGLAASVRDGFLAHAACLEWNGGAWLLCGRPGAGKTTLATALSSAGFGYGSDDVTIVRADGRVAGVPFAAALKEGAWDLCSRFTPDVPRLPVYLRPDGQRVRYLSPPRPPTTGPSPLSGILFLERAPGASVGLRRLEPAEALTRLLDASYSPKAALRPVEFLATAGALTAARSFELTYCGLDEAVSTIAELAGHE